MVLHAEGRGELVHDAAGDAGVVVFGFLSEEGLVSGGEDGIDKAFEKGGKAALEGSGGRETGTEGDRGNDEGIEPGDGVIEIQEALNDSTEVIGPLWCANFLAIGEVELDGVESGGSDAGDV